MTKKLIRNRFTIDPDAHSMASGLECTDESLTIQSELEQSDINTIVKQFGLTQQLPYGNDIPRYADYTDTPNDFHSALNFIADTESLFMEYPAHIRSHFKNDPGEFLSFLENPENKDQAIKLGFIPAPIVEAPAPKTTEPTSPQDASVAQSST